MPLTCSDDQKKATPFDFPKLESLRLRLRQIQSDQAGSLGYFAYGVGFQHLKGNNKISVSSSATCVLSLLATGSWTANRTDTKTLLKELISKDTSAGLPPDNPFTTAWILEAVTALEEIHPQSLDSDEYERVVKKEKILQDEVTRGGGGVSIPPYPASAYLTQLVVRVLRSRKRLTPELERTVTDWAWPELARQLALVQAKSKTQDAFAVAYLLMLVTAVTPSSKITPEQTSIQRVALNTVFACQLGDGTWPLSRPLFHYPKVGSAYCYEYEMLTQLLQQEELQDLLLDYLLELSAAAESVSNSVYRVEGGVQAWTSGHHPQKGGPESWATASAYHFLHQLDRLLAEAVRRELFRYLDLSFPEPGARDKSVKFAEHFLDSKVDVEGQPPSLKHFLLEKFVMPLAAEADYIVKGRKFKDATARSAIFFGPPGTSKTELSKEIAKFIGWPHLAMDPSHFLRKGMDGIQAEANAIFRILAEAERVVVLFDEFDELVRERESSDAEAFSRFLTTAMLPKLASIHKRATLVFIIATNNIAGFDLAIRRQGRFDRVVQIMPPTYEAKMAKKSWGPTKNLDLAVMLQMLGVEPTEDIKRQIGNLTYGECDGLVSELAGATTPNAMSSILTRRWNECTLRTHVSKARISEEEKITWEERCKAERKLTR